MSINWELEFLPFIEDLIIEFGQEATLTESTNSSYSTSSQTMTKSETDHTIKVASEKNVESFIGGKLVKDKRKALLVSPKGMTVVPKAEDKITLNGETFVVDEVDENKPGDVVLLYTLRLKI